MQLHVIDSIIIMLYEITIPLKFNQYVDAFDNMMSQTEKHEQFAAFRYCSMNMENSDSAITQHINMNI